MTVLVVPVDIVQAYSIKSNLKIRTSSCTFVKVKNGLILFFVKKKKKKKYLKTAAYLISHNASVKIKIKMNFYVPFIKILLIGTGFFSKFFHIEKTTKEKTTFVFLLL